VVLGGNRRNIHFFDVIFTLSEILENSQKNEKLKSCMINRTMNTSIYQEVEVFATEFKKKIQGARARREITAVAAQKSNEEIEDFKWILKHAGKVRGNIIQYGEQVEILVEENRRLRDQLIHSNNQLADHIQRMREKPRKKTAFGAGASVMDEQKPSEGLSSWW
tara:strand:- start:33 stop:524 length:492 start_codon:yes stop_codon:yes gene_type:complete